MVAYRPEPGLVTVAGRAQRGSAVREVPVDQPAMREDADRALVADLRAVLPRGCVLESAEDTYLYGRDASGLRGGHAGPVCLPETEAQVRDVVEVAGRHGRAVVARGAGTGLTGGAVPCDRPVVLSTQRLTGIGPIDVANGVAWVEPGVTNLDLSRTLRPHGFHFAPDPSSQQACTIGGNVANNSGGPHCLAYGVTNAHVVAIRMVTAAAEVVQLGGLDPDPPGLDLRGVVVGSEGMFGVVTRVAVRLTPNPPDVATLLVPFATVADAGACVAAIIGAGVVPAAIELMDQRAIEAVEAFVHAGYPLDAAAVLLVEVDGMPGAVTAERDLVADLARRHGGGPVRIAADETERALLWKGRKNAFGAVARIHPNYYLHDTVIPRGALPEVLEEIYAITRRHGLDVMNVFHAGDGNLHPLLMFDGREPGVDERVHAAGAEIVELSLRVGGVLSGEHGIGLEKRPFMRQAFGERDLHAQALLRRAFDPDARLNPGKVLPSGASCGDVRHLDTVPEALWV
jgi:glycolate oxidase